MRLLARWLAVPLLLFSVSCADDSPTVPPVVALHMQVMSGEAQIGEPGEELLDPLVVVVLDEKEKPVADQLVNFRVTEGGGSVYAGSAITGKDGVAADFWTLGSSGPQEVQARAVSSDGEKTVFATFTATLIQIDGDADGFTVAEGDCDDADPDTHPGAPDPVDANRHDTNCDGVDGDLGAAVLVATTGNDSGDCGSLQSPCRTVEAGIGRSAELDGAPDVYIAAGEYAESVVLPEGVSIYGGFASDFSAHDPDTFVTSLVGAPNGLQFLGQAEQAVTLLIANHSQSAEVADLRIVGRNASVQPDGRGGNAYAVAVANVSANVVLTRNRIEAGDGAAGTAGTDGVSASQAPAASGAAGAPGQQLATMCDATSRGAGGAGGGAGERAGGAGGAGGTMDTLCGPLGLASDGTPTSGLAGVNAFFTVSGGGQGGPGGTACQGGFDGRDGAQRPDGSGGAGGNGGALVGSTWISEGGSSGGLGHAGGGGGGGGGEGGCDGSPDSYGAGGGGGGAGGQPASAAGTGGQGGGASFGIYVFNATPTITDNEIVRGNGGDGGAGGTGGLGQPGGLGGPGGVGTNSSGGGDGGDGARGSHSGGGGGGAGGASVGIALIQAGSAVVEGNSMTGGSVGSPGDGGFSPTVPGSAGQPGALLDTMTP